MSRSMVSAKEAMMSTPFYDYSTRSGALDGYTGTYVRTYIQTHREMNCTVTSSGCEVSFMKLSTAVCMYVRTYVCTHIAGKRVLTMLCQT